MAEYPLLVFPKPEKVFRHRKKSVPIPSPRQPQVAAQSQRLGPKFEILQTAFDSQHFSVQESPDGIEPEKALVLELAGSVQDFQNAVEKVPGLEWLVDWSRDDLEPDDNFFFESDDGEPKDKPIRARLYVTMANRRGAEELVSLWRIFVDPSGTTDFRKGLKKFRKLFNQLYDLRFWDVQDRLEETGLREIWEERLAAGDEVIRPEIELWHRKSTEKRDQAEHRVIALIRAANGHVISRCSIPEIDYHAILAELPISSFESIFTAKDADLIRCDDIMFVRPRGQIATTPFENSSEPLEEIATAPLDLEGENLEPRVALLDGLPVENHSRLQGRLIVDDPEAWAMDSAVHDRKHGTAMASLVVCGDLSENEPSLQRPIYVRPVMKPQDTFGGSIEEIPNDLLTLDRIHRAVRRIFDGDGDEEAAAPTVVLINLSLGDSTRPFLRTMSPWARLIDYLSFRYRALFLVSSGNYPSLELPPGPNPENLTGSLREERILQAIKAQSRHRRLLSPAESINSLTIGALHVDASSPGLSRGYAFDPMPSGELLPAYFNAVGSGFRRSVKPELMIPGGRQLIRNNFGSGTSSVAAVSSLARPGQQVAYPPTGPQTGLNNTAFICGTSNSTALASRAGALVLEELELSESLGSLQQGDLATVTKALLVHGCSSAGVASILQDRMKLEKEQSRKRATARFLGYGTTDLSRVLRCSGERATLLGVGEFPNEKEEAHRYRVPLPPSLAARREWKRLTITLAWLTSINSSHQQYRRAALWFEPFGDQEFETRKNKNGREYRALKSPIQEFNASHRLDLKRKQADHQQVRNGTVQHEIFEGDTAVSFLDGDEVHIQVNCRAYAGTKLPEPIPYALAVTLEVAAGIGIPVYQEIRDRIRIPVAP